MRWRGLALGLLMVVCGAELMFLGACDGRRYTPSPTRTGTTIHPHSIPETSKADLGSGQPGAQCATNRLGHSFVKNGVRYQCKGPKPYRWRRM